MDDGTNEQDLIDDASRGDDAAREELVARYLPEIQRLVRARVGPLLGGDAESSDLAQSVARHALVHLDRFGQGGDEGFRSWYLKVAERKVIDWIRQRHAARCDARRVTSLDDDLREVAAPSAGSSRDAALEHLGAAIHALPKELREPLVLNRLEGLSLDEAADRLGLTYKQVRYRVDMARLRLSDALRRDGEDA